MIQQRSFATYLLLSIITCGIYSIYFWYKATEDMNVMFRDDGKPPLESYGTVWLLSLITCEIYMFVWYYNVGNRVKQNGDRMGANIKEDGQTLLLFALIGYFLAGIGNILASYFLIKNFNELAEVYNRGGGKSMY